MNKYILDSIKNNTKTIFLGMTKPQKKSLTFMIKRVFQTGSGILRESGDCQLQLPKTIAQKISYHLGEIDVLKPVEEFRNKQRLNFLPNNGVIAYDLTDVAKKSAKKIENRTDTFDGSERKYKILQKSRLNKTFLRIQKILKTILPDYQFAFFHNIS